MPALMAALLAVVLICSIGAAGSARARKRLDKRVQCHGCMLLVQHVEREIGRTKEKHMVQVKFRVDGKASAPYARSSYRVLEILDGAVGEAKKKKLRLAEAAVVASGGEPHRRFVELESGGEDKARRDLQKVWRFVIEYFEDEVLLAFAKAEDAPAFGPICEDLAALCSRDAIQGLLEAEQQEGQEGGAEKEEL